MYRRGGWALPQSPPHSHLRPAASRPSSIRRLPYSHHRQPLRLRRFSPRPVRPWRPCRRTASRAPCTWPLRLRMAKRRRPPGWSSISRPPTASRGCISQSDPLGMIEVPFVRIGDVVYTVNPQSGEWETSESSEAPIDFLDFIGKDVISNMKEPSVHTLGILNDVKVLSVTGMVTATDLGDTTLLRDSDIGGKGELEIVYWVGVDDSLVRRFIASVLYPKYAGKSGPRWPGFRQRSWSIRRAWGLRW